MWASGESQVIVNRPQTPTASNLESVSSMRTWSALPEGPGEVAALLETHVDVLVDFQNGEGGIRTHGAREDTLVFKTRLFHH